MTKIYIKLIAMSMALILSVSVVIMSSYAWLVLSGNPVVSGIQVAIGGGNTILTAPNVEYEVDGTIYHIPGRFSDRMNFSSQDHYAYLKELGNLTPVSTSNGIDWFLPAYYSGNDDLVQQGKIPSGALKDISEFQVDSFLTHANLTKAEQNKIDEGSYIYLDFWVVSPGGDYTLRVSTGTDTEEGGSFVVDLPMPEKNGNSYTLKEPQGSAAATVRIGFLANDLMLTDETMLQYKNSKYFDNRFTALKGLYQEPNAPATYLDTNHFTIYEPNADYHPANTDLNGSYVETRSLELAEGEIREQIRNHNDLNLTVQKRSIWAPAENGTGTAIEQRFQTALFAKLGESMTDEQRMNLFYGSYLQGQISPYVKKGAFIGRTYNLISYMGQYNGIVPESELADEKSGATEDVEIIKLERNVPQRIRMFIWLEGQDIDCVDSVSSSRFAVNIELAGGDQ